MMIVGVPSVMFVDLVETLGCSSELGLDQPIAPSRTSQAHELLLQQERQMQEEDTEELLHMARELKERFLAAKKVLDKDSEVLAQTDRAASKNQAKLSQESARLSAQTSQTSFTCCLMSLTLLVVLVMFVGTYIIIKLFPVRKVHNDL